MNELERKEFLQSKDEFSYLNAVRTLEGGLNHDETTKFNKLYKQLKTKLKLSKDILEQPLTGYDPQIPFNSKAKNFTEMKGVRDDGLLPNGENISDYFTKDAREFTKREYDVVQRWMGDEYKFFTEMDLKCNRDVNNFVENCIKKAKLYQKTKNPRYKPFWDKCITQDDKLLIKESEIELKKYGKGIVHDLPVLDDILNNQLKKNMKLYRVQKEMHLGDNPKVGDVVDFGNSRSTAVSKEGAVWFSETNSKDMSYLLEFEAPAGTKGAYLAPIKEGTFFGGKLGHSHPHFGEEYAREMEFLLKECKVKIVEMGKRTVKGTNGEKLKVIKLRILE